MLWAVIALGILLLFGAGICQLLLRMSIFAFNLICLVLFALVLLIYLTLRLFVPFVAKKLALAVPWLISAIVALGLTIYAFGRHFLHGENAIVFLEKLIPQRGFSRRTDFSLLVIALADSVHADIVEKLQAQIELLRKIWQFFPPVKVYEDSQSEIDSQRERFF